MAGDGRLQRDSQTRMACKRDGTSLEYGPHVVVADLEAGDGEIDGRLPLRVLAAAATMNAQALL